MLWDSNILTSPMLLDTWTRNNAFKGLQLYELTYVIAFFEIMQVLHSMPID